MKKLVETKSIGIPLTEDVAREVDALVKTLPKECTYRRKGALPDSAELVTGERADISMVSVESVDRDGDVVLAKGMGLEMFQRNPVVTFAHNYDELPVGCAGPTKNGKGWIKKVQGGIRAKTIYSDATDVSRACWKMTQEGILKGKSIGFIPTKLREATHEEVSRNPAWKSAVVIESAVMLEYACCAIPVNQDALVEAVAKGIADRKTLQRLGLLPASRKLTEQQIAAIVKREFARLAKELTPERIRQKLLDSYRV